MKEEPKPVMSHLQIRIARSRGRGPLCSHLSSPSAQFPNAHRSHAGWGAEARTVRADTGGRRDVLCRTEDLQCGWAVSRLLITWPGPFV